MLRGEEIGEEVHHLDQFIRLEEGQARIIIDGTVHEAQADDAVVIPEGTRHNVIKYRHRTLEALHGVLAAGAQGRHGRSNEGR